MKANRNQRKFKNIYDAKVQCLALSKFYPRGRWIVVQIKELYIVAYDECKSRFGTDESEILFCSESNCNSGTADWKTCRNEAEESMMYE